MKIKMKEMPYGQVLALPPMKHRKPKRPLAFWRYLIKILSLPTMWNTHFTWKKIGMEKLGKDEPCLYLMNHSSFTDMKMAGSILYKKPYHIVSTLDGFVGLDWLMRWIGCIPTKKFIYDLQLIRDMRYALKDLKDSVLMYPEAGYSYDGTATVLPDSLGKCLKMLKVPVVMIRTYGAYARDPLYNELQIRKVKVSADVEYILSPEEIAAKSVDELNAILREKFSFDNFRWQQENQICIDEKFRTDGLHRILYKCPHCGQESRMKGKGTQLTCEACGVTYELTEYGSLKALNAETKFQHVPDWYRWERECVRKEIEEGTYKLDADVDICMIVNTKCMYKVGAGHLSHTAEGFHLTGCDGQLDYSQKPGVSYSVNADFYWYEIGDMISIGDEKEQYYCFPKVEGDWVAKTRLATEELYKMVRK